MLKTVGRLLVKSFRCNALLPVFIRSVDKHTQFSEDMYNISIDIYIYTYLCYTLYIRISQGKVI